MIRSSAIGTLLATALVALTTASAWAQDYVVTSVSGQYSNPPASGLGPNLVGATKGRDNNTYLVSSLPFPIFYFGKYYTSMQVCTNGFVQFGGGASIATTAPNMPLAGADDGICAPAWDDLDGSGAGANLTYWTEGNAPNRKFVVAWLSWTQAPTTGSLSFEVQFFEGSGRIQMAYGPGWTSQTTPKAVGIDAVSPDGRFVTPNGTARYYNAPTAQPANDWRFDPKITYFTGRLDFDRYVVDATGIGNSLESGIPLSGVGVEMRAAGGATVARGVTDASGNFSIQGMALVGTDLGSLVVTSECTAATVRPSAAAAPYATTIMTNVPFASDRDFGAIVLAAGNDPAGAAREPLNIARTISSVYEWCLARAPDAIAPIDVYYDPASAASTSYTPAGAGPATMRVGGAAANPDAWDVDVIRKTYARHVLTVVAGAAPSAIDTAFDKATDPENAFFEGAGYYIAAAISRSSKYTDGTSASAAAQIDLESPTILTPKGADVAAWVAAALFDLTDGTSPAEAWDTFDGAGAAAGNLYVAVASLTSVANASKVYTAWGASGFAGADIARDFIHHGLIGDDADEPNDVVAQSRSVAEWGFIRTARVLNLYNDDWYQFVLPAATNAMTLDVIYDRAGTGAEVSLELLRADGSPLATGVWSGVAGPLRAVTGALAPGTYRARVRHVSGGRVDAYTLQAFSELTLSADSFKPWTVNRPYNVPVDVRGGIPPYSLTVEQPFVKPPGLILDGPNSRVVGAPSEAGTFNFSLTARDLANPNNLASVPQMLTVNPELVAEFGEFTAFPMGKVLNRAGAFTGGTAPYTFETVEGQLPAGVAIAAADGRITGSAATPGSTHFKLRGTDTAGSASEGSTLGVVCAPFGTTPLAEGPSACGFWFDAVEGTVVSIKVKTSKKQPKRALRVALLADDGTTEVPATAKPGTGKASASFVAPSSGRFYCVIASDAGAATELAGSAKLTPGKGGKGDSGTKTFVPGSSFEVDVGALAGATLSFSAKPDKSGLVMKVQYLLDPTGAAVSLNAGEFTEKAGAVSFTRTLPMSGTWQVVLGAKPGPQGKFTYSFKLKQPKGGVYSAD